MENKKLPNSQKITQILNDLSNLLGSEDTVKVGVLLDMFEGVSVFDFKIQNRKEVASIIVKYLLSYKDMISDTQWNYREDSMIARECFSFIYYNTDKVNWYSFSLQIANKLFKYNEPQDKNWVEYKGSANVREWAIEKASTEKVAFEAVFSSARVPEYTPTCCLIDLNEMQANLFDTRPYTHAWASKLENPLRPFGWLFVIQYPYFETLCTAGYAFAKQLIDYVGQPKLELNGRRDGYDTKDYSWIVGDNIKYIQSCTQDGTSPKDILKCDIWLAKALKEQTDIAVWNNYRQMYKMKRMTKEAITGAIADNLKATELKYYNELLRQKTYDGKLVFKWETLQNKIHRLDMYEAIELKAAHQYLMDYLKMCRDLRKVPVLDGDSLKREHDVTAREHRELSSEIDKSKYDNAIRKVHDQLADYSLEDDGFFVRPIIDYDDLIDESHQQENCLSCYGSYYTSKTPKQIFVCRKQAAPSQSYVSIELAPDASRMYQCFLADNREITDSKTKAFIDKWLKHCQKVYASKEQKGGITA